MSTPTKISPRNPVCRLCGDSHESRYMLRLFSKAGSTKDLYPKVYKTCGIKNISEDDLRSKVLRQQELCFIRKQDGTVCSESPIHREYAVRSKLRICCKAMCSAFTFPSTVEAFIIEYAIYARGGAVKLKPITPTRKQISFSTPQPEDRAAQPLLRISRSEILRGLQNIRLSRPCREPKLEFQVKNSFLYSILMNERWHELNLVNRVNTVLIIEGGCTKKVSNII